MVQGVIEEGALADVRLVADPDENCLVHGYPRMMYSFTLERSSVPAAWEKQTCVLITGRPGAFSR